MESSNNYLQHVDNPPSLYIRSPLSFMIHAKRIITKVKKKTKKQKDQKERE
jgi:hypothetical protein